jgi:hypothetical protein
MKKNYKITNIIDRYSVAINITKDELEGLGLSKGDIAKIVQKTIEIKDPETHESLGIHTLYKESLEISDIQEKFIIATNYKYKNNTPLTFALTNTKQKTALNIDSHLPVETEKDRQINIGDKVDFFK